MEERNKRLRVSADYVLLRLVEIDQMDVLDILNDDGGLKPIRSGRKSGAPRSAVSICPQPS